MNSLSPNYENTIFAYLKELNNNPISLSPITPSTEPNPTILVPANSAEFISVRDKTNVSVITIRPDKALQKDQKASSSSISLKRKSEDLDSDTCDFASLEINVTTSYSKYINFDFSISIKEYLLFSACLEKPEKLARAKHLKTIDRIKSLKEQLHNIHPSTKEELSLLSPETKLNFSGISLSKKFIQYEHFKSPLAMFQSFLNQALDLAIEKAKSTPLASKDLSAIYANAVAKAKTDPVETLRSIDHLIALNQQQQELTSVTAWEQTKQPADEGRSVKKFKA